MALEGYAPQNPEKVYTDVLSESRQACYKARDEFYACLERESNKKPTEIATVGLLYPVECKKCRDNFVNQCRPTWNDPTRGFKWLADCVAVAGVSNDKKEDSECDSEFFRIAYGDRELEAAVAVTCLRCRVREAERNDTHRESADTSTNLGSTGIARCSHSCQGQEAHRGTKSCWGICKRRKVKHFDRQYASKKRLHRLLDDNESRRVTKYRLLVGLAGKKKKKI